MTAFITSCSGRCWACSGAAAFADGRPDLTPADAILNPSPALTPRWHCDRRPGQLAAIHSYLSPVAPVAGGIGIIVVAVAVLPMLGIGGMQLYKAETPGPSKNSKLTPRITETAKVLFAVYLTLTIACALTYYLGMSTFDAIAHSFSTVSLGGFSTHDASLGFLMTTY